MIPLLLSFAELFAVSEIREPATSLPSVRAFEADNKLIFRKIQ
jgi:hypothetical protein